MIQDIMCTHPQGKQAADKLLYHYLEFSQIMTSRAKVA